MVETEIDFLSKIIFIRTINRLGRPFGINPFPRAFENELNERDSSSQQIFDLIHRKNFWGSSESRSGVGSENDFTRAYRNGLSTLIIDYKFQSIFDAPCGDLNWMSDFLTDNDIHYMGGDISREVVFEAQHNYPELDLRVFDIAHDQFPDCDVWHCRDCLFHLPFEAIYLSFENFLRSRIPYALITSHRARVVHKNLDVGYGGFRFLDLQRAPFLLPAPISRISDYRKGNDFPRFVGLWKREQIAESLADAKTRSKSDPL